jgi:hypothetical protein
MKKNIISLSVILISALNCNQALCMKEEEDFKEECFVYKKDNAEFEEKIQFNSPLKIPQGKRYKKTISDKNGNKYLESSDFEGQRLIQKTLESGSTVDIEYNEDGSIKYCILNNNSYEINVFPDSTFKESIKKTKDVAKKLVFDDAFELGDGTPEDKKEEIKKEETPKIENVSYSFWDYFSPKTWFSMVYNAFNPYKFFALFLSKNSNEKKIELHKNNEIKNKKIKEDEIKNKKIKEDEIKSAFQVILDFEYDQNNKILEKYQYIENFGNDIFSNKIQNHYQWNRFQDEKNKYISVVSNLLKIEYPEKNLWRAAHLIIDPLEEDVVLDLSFSSLSLKIKSKFVIASYEDNNVGQVIKEIQLPVNNTFEENCIKMKLERNKPYIIRFLQYDAKSGEGSLMVNNFSLKLKPLNQKAFWEKSVLKTQNID